MAAHHSLQAGPTVTDPVLRAAYECVMDVGLRRTTLADVARRAGVSRMTVYRSYPDLSAIVSALLTAELLALIGVAAREAAALPTARERVVESTALAVERVARHPLFRRILDVDPELLLPLIVDRLGSTQRAAIDELAAQIAEGQQDGSIRTLDPREAATFLQIAAQAFVFGARVVDSELPAHTLPGELRRLFDGYLTRAPLL